MRALVAAIVAAVALAGPAQAAPGEGCVSRREAVVAGNERMLAFEARVDATPWRIVRNRDDLQTRYYNWCPGLGESFGARFRLVEGRGWLLKRAFLSSAQP